MRRVLSFQIVLALIQLCHLLLFVDSKFGYFLIWFFVHSIAFFTTGTLRHSARHCVDYFFIPWRILAILFIVAFVFKFLARVPDLQNFLTDGLLGARNNLGTKTVSLSTYFSVFFYPLSIILAFCVMPRSVYRLLLVGVLAICAIEFIAVGTRGAPTFVLLFFILTMNSDFRARARLIVGLLCLVMFFIVFNYSTINRTGASGEGSFDWLVLFQFTASAEILKINLLLVAEIFEWFPPAMPIIFLMHYLTHPIAELHFFLGSSFNIDLGGFVGIRDQFCAVGFCNRVESSLSVWNSNVRSGVYQTAWASWILDFGLIGALSLYAIFSLMLYISQVTQRRQLRLGVVFYLYIVMLSPIENYLFVGLGFVPILLTFLVALFMRLLYIFFSICRKWGEVEGQDP